MRSWLGVIILAWSTMVAWPAAAERDLVVGVEDVDYLPAYGWRDNSYSGAARDIIDAFAAANGYRPIYRPLPIKRLFAELVSGGVDVKFPDNPLWGQDSKLGAAISYSRPVIEYIDGVMVTPNRRGKTIATLGTVAGFTPTPWLERIKAGQVALKENLKLDPLLRQVLLGRLDGAYVSVAVANYTLDTGFQMPGALVFDPSQPFSRESYRLSSARRPDLIAAFDAWLAAHAAEVKAIKDSYHAEKGVE